MAEFDKSMTYATLYLEYKSLEEASLPRIFGLDYRSRTIADLLTSEIETIADIDNVREQLEAARGLRCQCLRFYSHPKAVRNHIVFIGYLTILLRLLRPPIHGRVPERIPEKAWDRLSQSIGEEATCRSPVKIYKKARKHSCKLDDLEKDLEAHVSMGPEQAHKHLALIGLLASLIHGVSASTVREDGSSHTHKTGNVGHEDDSTNTQVEDEASLAHITIKQLEIEQLTSELEENIDCMLYALRDLKTVSTAVAAVAVSRAFWREISALVERTELFGHEIPSLGEMSPLVKEQTIIRAKNGAAYHMYQKWCFCLAAADVRIGMVADSVRTGKHFMKELALASNLRVLSFRDSPTINDLVSLTHVRVQYLRALMSAMPEAYAEENFREVTKRLTSYRILPTAADLLTRLAALGHICSLIVTESKRIFTYPHLTAFAYAWTARHDADSSNADVPWSNITSPKLHNFIMDNEPVIFLGLKSGETDSYGALHKRLISKHSKTYRTIFKRRDEQSITAEQTKLDQEHYRSILSSTDRRKASKDAAKRLQLELDSLPDVLLLFREASKTRCSKDLHDRLLSERAFMSRLVSQVEESSKSPLGIRFFEKYCLKCFARLSSHSHTRNGFQYCGTTCSTGDAHSFVK